MIYLKKLLLFLFVLGVENSISAQVKLPALVADNMVLQQNAKVNLWGWASPNEKITITLGWENLPVELISDANGNWKTAVNTPKGSDKMYDISINASNNITLRNILIGEVWLCSGQSNMFFPVGREDKTWKTGVKNYEEEVKNASFPNIRLFTVALNASPTPLEDVTGNWKVCTPESIQTFSAVAYFFGRDLYQQLHVPIGLISTSWGGTKAEAWTAQTILENDVTFLPILQEDAKNEKLHQEKLEAYYLNLTNERIASAENTPKGQLKKPKKEPNKTSYVLYNAMLHPIVNYTIKGAIWYQGESNSGKAFLYRTLFPAMVKSWREEWKQGDFPFYYVQITPHKGQ
ncbi:MAG: sialate O-acetylesterase, partial [Flavobacterium sp.]